MPQNEENIMRCAAYIRVSTEEQARKGLSLENQEKSIKEYIARNGWTLVDTYIDKGISARKKLTRRTEFLRMMEDVKAHRVNHIVVLRLDRFFRNVYDYHWMMKTYLDPAGCGWSAVMEEYDTTTTNGRLMINLRLSIAEQEADTDSDRIKDVFENRIKAGFAVTGTCAFGYRINEQKRYEIVPENAAVVRDCFETLLQCGSVRDTYARITAKYGKRFDSTTFYRMFRKEIYIGKYRDNLTFAPPIVDLDTWNEAQRVIDNNKNYYQKNGKRRHNYIFHGIVKCAVCGKNMSGCSNNGGTFGYRCTAHYIGRTCPNNKTLSESKLTEYLLNNIADIWESSQAVTATEKAKAPTVKSNRAQVEAKMRRLRELYIDDKITKDEFDSRYITLQQSIVDPKPRQTAAEPRRRTEAILRQNLPHIYKKLTDEEKSRFWRGILAAILIGKDGVVNIEFL